MAAHREVARCPPSAWNGVRHGVECALGNLALTGLVHVLELASGVRPAADLGDLACRIVHQLLVANEVIAHVFLDRLRGCGDVPVPIAEAITGHGLNASEFARYGSVGYTLEQKKAVIERILI